MPIEMKPVKSSNIQAIGYDEPSQTMHIAFTSGKTYAYHGVTPEQHGEFLHADSIGSHFARRIRPHFSGKPV